MSRLFIKSSPGNYLAGATEGMFHWVDTPDEATDFSRYSKSFAVAILNAIRLRVVVPVRLVRRRAKRSK